MVEVFGVQCFVVVFFEQLVSFGGFWCFVVDQVEQVFVVWCEDEVFVIVVLFFWMWFDEVVFQQDCFVVGGFLF